jgi:hypothetical protein
MHRFRNYLPTNKKGDGLVSKELAQGEKDVALLLAAGGNEGLQPRIHLSAFWGPKAAADFLFHLGRAEVAFRLVVGGSWSAISRPHPRQQVGV